ncbi:MAG: hypothetical protein V4513_00655 [Pseudomonadota bacterium]
MKMVGSRFKGVLGIVVGSSLLFSTTAAVASPSAAPVQQVNPWAALAVLSGAQPAAVVCGSAGASAAAAAAAAAQGGTGCVLPANEPAPPVAQAEPPAPIPVPPVEVAGAGLGFNPLLLALAAIAAGIGLYAILKKKTNSPT